MQLRRLCPTADWVRLAIVPALVFIALSVNHGYLLDFWHHLARGRAIVTEGKLLGHDIFTFTVAGTSIRDVNWLSQIVYYLLYQQGGLALVQLVNSLLLALTFFLLVLMCWQRCYRRDEPGGSLIVAVTVSACAFFASWEILTLRPQTFSLLLFVLVYWSLENSRRKTWLLLVPPVLIALWTNLHGAFPAGIMLVGCYLLGAVWEAWRRGNVWKDHRSRLLAGCLAASCLTTLFNPYGWTIYQYVGQTSNRAAERGIGEWLPPSFDLLAAWALVLSVIAVVGLHAAAWFRLRRRPRAHEVFLMLCFAALACRSVRMTVWWFVIIAPMLAELVTALCAGMKQATDNSTNQEKPSLAAAVMFSLICLAVVFSLPGLDRYNPLLQLSGRSSHRTETDLEAVHQHLLKHGQKGRIFTRFEWGEYFAWSAAPDFKIFMDGRIEIYPDAVWQQYSEVTRGKDNWQRVLDKYHVNYLVLDPEFHAKSGLLAQVEQSPRWQKTFQVDDKVYLYVRQEDNAVARLRPPRTHN